MSIRLPFLAFVLIVVGLVLSGAGYMRLTLAPIEHESEIELTEEEEIEVAETEEEEDISTPQTPSTSTPAPVEEESAGYTLPDVRAHASASSCWTVISGNVYDLTSWISRHPGGRSAITGLCGKDGTKDFLDQHDGDRSAESRLASFLLGPLE